MGKAQPDTLTTQQQSLRLERLRLAIYGSGVAVGVTFLASVAGYLPGSAALRFALIAVGLVAAFLWLIRAGLNLRFRDPSLTLPMLAASGLAVSYVVYEGHAARPLFLALYIVAFMFGVFTLGARRLAAVALFYVACYGAVIALLAAWRPEVTDLRRELLRLGGMAILLAWFSALGAYVSRLRVQLREANARLEEALRAERSLAQHDALTGCYNRRYATESLEREARHADRGTPCTVCLCDLDHFKSVNDRHGHGVGDDVLKACAAAIGAGLRATDVLARFGGEEFLIIFAATPLEPAAAVAERLRERVATLPMPALAGGPGVTVSMGLAEHKALTRVEDTLARADRALYRAKAEGRNRVVVQA